MALDPKQVLLENKALSACYVAALAALVVQIVVVMPLSGETNDRKAKRLAAQGKGTHYLNAVKKVKGIDRSLKQLAGRVRKGDLLTNADKTVWEAHKVKLQGKLAGLSKFYVDKDQELEKWFSDLELKTMGTKPGQFPDAGRFQEIYKSKFEKLKKKYEKLTKTEDGSVLKPANTGGGAEAMIIIQKSHWFKVSLLEAMAASKVEKLLTNISVISQDSLEAIAKGYKVYDCNFVVQLKFADLPTFLRALLAAKLTFEVKSLAVTQLDFKITMTKPGSLSVNSTAERKFFDKGVYDVKFPEGVPEFKGSEADLVPEPAVTVKMRVFGLDFLPPKVKKAGPAPEEPK
jgi:hypothetical protein